MSGGHHFDLYAIGNALVDTEFAVTDQHLDTLGIEKGRMTLIEEHDRSRLLGQLHALGQSHPARRTGGGSAGNTVVALAQLGGRAFYSCTVAHDELGAFYHRDLEQHGVATNLSHTAAPDGQTGNCLVLITPDGERSMCTFLGQTQALDRQALHPMDLQRSRIYYMEGYLAASPSGLDAALAGRALARAHGVALATTLSDVSMIRFCREGLEALVGHADLDFLFANEDEALAWTGTNHTEDMLQALTGTADTVCVTRGPLGCVILHQGQRLHVPSPSVQAVDTNGAGDMFAGAFLYGRTQGLDLETAGALACRCAATVVSQPGNRLSTETLRGLLKGH